jgi:imidazoleglycerol phosphate dehydratase HisB
MLHSPFSLVVFGGTRQNNFSIRVNEKVAITLRWIIDQISDDKVGIARFGQVGFEVQLHPRRFRS